MVTDNQRKIALWLVKLGLWRHHIWMRMSWIHPKWGTKWIHDWMLKQQKLDELHHAPACPANHYHNTRLTFQPCSCGVEKVEKEEKEDKNENTDRLEETQRT